MRRWEICRYTFRQLVNALTVIGDSDDPHAGQIEIGSLAEIDELLG
jgi:hypothetical protein